MTKEILSLQMDKSGKQFFKEVADRRGLSTSEAARIAIEIWASIEDDVWEEWTRHSRDFGVPVHVVIQNQYIAKRIEDSRSSANIVKEYPKLRDGSILTGAEFAGWYEKSIRDEQKARLIVRAAEISRQLTTATGERAERLKAKLESINRGMARLIKIEENNEEEV